MRDFEYFKSLYPQEAKRLQLFVEAVVDEVDYEGSPIYDEYPDRLFVEQLTSQADKRAREEGDIRTGTRVSDVMELEGNGYRMWEPRLTHTQELSMQEWGRPPQGPPPQGPPPPPPPPGPPKPLGQWDLVNVLLMHELQQRRRCQNGRCRF